MRTAPHVAVPMATSTSLQDVQVFALEVLIARVQTTVVVPTKMDTVSVIRASMGLPVNWNVPVVHSILAMDTLSGPKVTATLTGSVSVKMDTTAQTAREYAQAQNEGLSAPTMASVTRKAIATANRAGWVMSVNSSVLVDCSRVRTMEPAAVMERIPRSVSAKTGLRETRVSSSALVVRMEYAMKTLSAVVSEATSDHTAHKYALVERTPPVISVVSVMKTQVSVRVVLEVLGLRVSWSVPAGLLHHATSTEHVTQRVHVYVSPVSGERLVTNLSVCTTATETGSVTKVAVSVMMAGKVSIVEPLKSPDSTTPVRPNTESSSSAFLKSLSVKMLEKFPLPFSVTEA